MSRPEHRTGGTAGFPARPSGQNRAGADRVLPGRRRATHVVGPWALGVHEPEDHLPGHVGRPADPLAGAAGPPEPTPVGSMRTAGWMSTGDAARWLGSARPVREWFPHRGGRATAVAVGVAISAAAVALGLVFLNAGTVQRTSGEQQAQSSTVDQPTAGQNDGGTDAAGSHGGGTDAGSAAAGRPGAGAGPGPADRPAHPAHPRRAGGPGPDTASGRARRRAADGGPVG